MMTVDQYRLLPDRDDVIQELHLGTVVTVTRPKMKHSKIQLRLVELLQPLARNQGVVATEVAFRALPEFDLRGADVAFVSQSRWGEFGQLPFEPPGERMEPEDAAVQQREPLDQRIAAAYVFALMDQDGLQRSRGPCPPGIRQKQDGPQPADRDRYSALRADDEAFGLACGAGEGTDLECAED
jgi:hypothetical protein